MAAIQIQPVKRASARASVIPTHYIKYGAQVLGWGEWRFCCNERS
jgi:hypothetical protein